MKNVTPVRKKAIETRQRLLEKTVYMLGEKGYHNITVDEIAKEAGMSTGIAYRYFKNKKEMLLAALEYYFSNIQEISDTEMNQLSAFSNLEEKLKYVLEQFYNIHMKYYGIHEELESLRHIDTDVKVFYEKSISKALDIILEKCPEEYKKIKNLREKLYIAISILENYVHLQMKEIICNELNMENIKKWTINSVMELFKGDEE